MSSPSPTASTSNAPSRSSLATLVQSSEPSEKPHLDAPAEDKENGDDLVMETPSSRRRRSASLSSHRSKGKERVPPQEFDISSFPTDVAPVDFPEPLRQLDDHHAFAELARHLSVDPPPDGGLEAWLVIAGAWLVLFVEFGMLTSFGQFQSYYEKHQLSNYPKSTVSWIGSISTFLTFGLSLFAGRAFDMYGARWLIIGGTTIAVLSLVALAFCKEFYQFLLAHALFGLAGAALYSPCTAVVAHWFQKRRSTAIGLILCGSGLGGVIFPIVLNRLFIQIGFRNTVLTTAGMSAILFFPAWFTIKTRLPPKPATPWSHARLPWKEGRYTVFVLGVAMIWFNYFTPFFFANDFSLAQGLTPELADYSVAILNVGSFFGRALSGPVAELFGAIEVFVISGILSGITILALWTSTSVGVVGTVFGLFLYGFFSGAVIALIAACCAQLSPVKEFGLRLGMMWSVASLPLLAGPQISGVLIAQSASTGYMAMALFVGFSLIAGSCMSFAPVYYHRAVDRWRHGKGIPGVMDPAEEGEGMGGEKRAPVASRV